MCAYAISNSVRTAKNVVLVCLFGLLSAGLVLAQGQPGPGMTANDVENMDRLTDFTNGVVEEISGVGITVHGQEFLFGDTVFVNMIEEFIDKEDITQGDYVQVIFDPEDNQALKVELQTKSAELEKNASQQEDNQPKRKDMITLEKGVYRN